jgi:hypothetical protein
MSKHHATKVYVAVCNNRVYTKFLLPESCTFKKLLRGHQILSSSSSLMSMENGDITHGKQTLSRMTFL